MNDKLLAKVLKKAQDMAATDERSSARFFTWGTESQLYDITYGVCFHMMPGAINSSSIEGLCLSFAGYGGFKTGDRFRKATMDDIASDKDSPFVLNGPYHYGEQSLAFLSHLLDPNGPFRALLPHMLETDPKKVQEAKCFIFPDVHKVPRKLLYTFAIMSRQGVANARIMWMYLLMVERGVPTAMASLIAEGFAEEVVKGVKTGKWIKSYCGGWLGVDATAYAYRWINGIPELEYSYGSTTGSGKCFRSQDNTDLKNLRFETFDDVLAYINMKYAEQEKAHKAKAA